MKPVSRERIQELLEAQEDADEILEAEHYNLTDQGPAKNASLWRAVRAYQSSVSGLHDMCMDILRYGLEPEPVEPSPLDPDDAYAQHLAARRERR